ncbi:hypothetical protein ACFXB3_28175 [Streptomyces sp. NPDC059447]|uniref:hypothetical protein n=1 Tax=Streptomyces sp. NPDC059447 TaxID=3346834 RepID=UPI003674FBA9
MSGVPLDGGPGRCPLVRVPRTGAVAVFPGPYERYKREYADGCLKSSAYQRDMVQAMVDDGVLTVTPTSGATTLRLGPAKNGSSTQPLRPLDQATQAVLNEHKC